MYQYEPCASGGLPRADRDDEGETAAAEFDFIKRSSTTLRHAGHDGEAVEHCAWGRAKFSALQRLVKAFHKADVFAAAGRTSSHELSMTQFVVCTPCACRDAQKGQ